MRVIKDNIKCVSEHISLESQAVKMHCSDDGNCVICIKPSYNGYMITNVDFYGYFGVSPLKYHGNKQCVYTKLGFDNEGVLYCHITDFLCFGSCGYGSAMMKVMKEYYNRLSVAYISGWISPVDSQDTKDKEHNERLHHFYKKHGFYFYWKGEKEFIRLDLKEKTKCSKEYIEHTTYQLENSAYEDNFSSLLFKGIISMNDLNRTIRINAPNLYLYGLKSAAGSGSDKFYKTLELLCSDIDSITNDGDSSIREALISRLHSYIDPLRYFTDNESLSAFAEEKVKKYPLHY